jgi:hypothetical protein
VLAVCVWRSGSYHRGSRASLISMVESFVGKTTDRASASADDGIISITLRYFTIASRVAVDTE